MLRMKQIMERKATWLEQAALRDAYDRVIVDNSVVTPDMGNAGSVMISTKFCEMDLGELDDVMNQEDEMLKLLGSHSSGKIITVPEVLSEFGRLQERVRSHYNLISSVEGNRMYKAGKHINPKHRCYPTAHTEPVLCLALNICSGVMYLMPLCGVLLYSFWYCLSSSFM